MREDEMFYPSGDDVDRMIELAIQCGIDNRGTSWPVELCRVRTELRALLARTEAGADGELCRAAPAGGDGRHSTHHVHRGPESLPCYCNASDDHSIGHEVNGGPDEVALSIARQFVSADEPQKLAKLQCAIIRAISSAPAGSGEVEGLADTLVRMADNAYCDYIRKMQRPECLGWEEKVRRGSFDSENLRAHVGAGELLGRHRALHEADALLRKLQQGAE